MSLMELSDANGVHSQAGFRGPNGHPVYEYTAQIQIAGQEAAEDMQRAVEPGRRQAQQPGRPRRRLCRDPNGHVLELMTVPQ